MKRSIKNQIIWFAVISVAYCFFTACEKDIFYDTNFKVDYELDGVKHSYHDPRSLFARNPGKLYMFRRNDTTFFYSPAHLWGSYQGYINLIDENNQTLPEKSADYQLKSGILFSTEKHSNGPFTENLIYVGDFESGNIEIISGRCSLVRIKSKYGTEIHNGIEFRGVKISFEAAWRDIESGEEHVIKNGEAYFASRVVKNAE